jgi:hypothetical protein
VLADRLRAGSVEPQLRILAGIQPEAAIPGSDRHHKLPHIPDHRCDFILRWHGNDIWRLVAHGDLADLGAGLHISRDGSVEVKAI